MIRALTTILLGSLITAGCAGPNAPSVRSSERTPLPQRYVTINPAELTDSATLDRRCAIEEAAAREHLAALESFEGAPTIGSYYQSFNSLTATLNSVEATVSSLSRIHPDLAFRSAGEACSQLLGKLDTDISLSRPIWEAISKLDLAGADSTTQHSVSKLLLSFRLAGVDRDAATRQRIRELNERIVALGQEFNRNISSDVRYLELDSIDALKGLPNDFVQNHASTNGEPIRVSTQYPDLFPFMEYSERDDLRQALARITGQRGYPANDKVLRNLLQARFELARLVGFDNYAQLATADKMSGSADRVAKFIDELKSYTGDVQDREYAMLLARLREEQPDAERVESWQRSWIQGKVSREQFGVDSREVRRYFNYENTRDGLFALVEDLFGVRIEPWATPTWHEDVAAYELWEGDQQLGRFYLDMHPREGKYQHAAMFTFAVGIKDQQLPVAALVCNFPKGNAPMQFSQVQTFLHEFGHLLHFQFAGNQPWTNTTGISMEWDFVEAPSQMLEEWVWNYETLSTFARDKDGNPLPRPLHKAMVAERDFGLGMGTRGQLALAQISLQMYDSDPAEVDFDAIFNNSMAEMTRFQSITDTHRWASFGHLNGYSAIYYTYQWSKAIATDMFTRFEAAGLRDQTVAQAYRNRVLTAGGSRPAEESVTAFLGRPISFEPYAEQLRGQPAPATSDE